MSDTISAPMAQVEAVPSGVDWALYAASCGWRVFPIVPGTKAPYATKATATALGVNPDNPAGVHHARDDETSIRALWSGDRADAMIGVAMGDGRLAIDVDEKNGKSGSATLSANAWTIPATATQRTQSGGYHCILNVVPGTAAPTDRGDHGLGTGLDRRGDGGYIALYDPAVLTAPRAPAPEWSLSNVRTCHDRERITSPKARRAPSYEIALTALRRREPGEMDRNEWLLLSGSFYIATDGLASDEQRLADWQAWNVAHGETNDPAANARTWAGFGRTGTGGDFDTLASITRDPIALAWRFFKGESIPARPAVHPANDPASLFVRIADMEARPPVFLVDGLVEEDALAVLFGDPASGKSLVAIDMAASIATGRPFHCRSVRRGAVFYIAGEGKNGLRRRFGAWEALNGESLDLSPLYVSRAAVQFLDNNSAAMVIAAIDALAVTHGIPRMIVVDTLARNFGAGDENSQKDMNGFVAALDQLRERFPGSTVLLVHHSGHGDKDRARGSSVLRGAVDAEYKVAKVNDAVHLTNHKMKDAAPPPPMAFDLIETAGSVALEYKGEPSPKGGKPSAIQSLALQAFGTVADEGRVTLEAWRAAFYALHTGSETAKRRAFGRGRDWMLGADLIRSDDSGANFERTAMPGTPVAR